MLCREYKIVGLKKLMTKHKLIYKHHDRRVTLTHNASRYILIFNNNNYLQCKSKYIVLPESSYANEQTGWTQPKRRISGSRHYVTTYQPNFHALKLCPFFYFKLCLKNSKFYLILSAILFFSYVNYYYYTYLILLVVIVRLFVSMTTLLMF